MKQNYAEYLKDNIFKIISETADALELNCYVIGGFVRDLLLKRDKPTDIDILVVGDGIKLAQEVANRISNQPKVITFKTFGTAMLKYQNTQIEFVGARKESYTKESRNPKIQQGSLEDDQARRDFTINALALGLSTTNFGVLFDPFKGVEDLNNKIIQTPLNPSITYSDDPLRMLRAVRFASQLLFQITPASLEAIKVNRSRISIISKERIVEELHKILMTSKPSIGFLLLHKTGLLKLILPELTNLEGVEEIEGQGHKDNFYHTLEVVDNISRHSNNLWLRWAALLHDIGKAPTKYFDKVIGWTFHGHEFTGSKMVYRLFKRLKMPLNDAMKFTQKMVLMSSRPIILAEDVVTDSAIRRLIFDTGEHIDDLLTLCEADITTKNKAKFKKYHHNFKIVRQKIALVEERDRIRNFQPPISGQTIMNSFKIQPSKTIGIIKEAIKDAILEGEIPNEYETAYAFMIKKGQEMGLNLVKSKKYESEK